MSGNYGTSDDDILEGALRDERARADKYERWLHDERKERDEARAELERVKANRDEVLRDHAAVVLRNTELTAKYENAKRKIKECPLPEIMRDVAQAYEQNKAHGFEIGGKTGYGKAWGITTDYDCW